MNADTRSFTRLFSSAGDANQMKRYRRRRSWCRNFSTLLAVCLVCLGCASGSSTSSTVSGTVLLDGQPVGNGTILLIANSGASASSTLTPEGSYQLKCLPGDYKIAISPPLPGDPMIKSLKSATTPGIVIPTRYQDVGTSGLQAQFVKGANTFDIELQANGKSR